MKRRNFPRYTTRDGRAAGFTIIELLVVIVVIAILAAITIVAFNGVQQRAADAALRSDISGAGQLLGVENALNGTYPASGTLGSLDGGKGLPVSVDTTYEYTTDTASFCLTATSQKAKASYYVSSTKTTSTEGTCPGHTGYVAGPAAAKDEWLAVATEGIYHACGIGADQKAYCWGDNTYGQLGNGTTTSSSTPIAVSQGAIPSGATITAISTGSYASCAVASDNNIYCWGISGLGPQWVNSTTPVAIARGAIPAGASIKKIDIDSVTNCALTTAGAIYCWGDNSSGNFGNGTTNGSAVPVAASQGAMPGGVTIKDMDTGGYSVCVIGSDDHVYCWGNNNNGQLGDGTQTSRSLPVAVLQGAMPASGQLSSISVGSGSTCTIMAAQRAYCWGAGGRTGDNTNTRRTSPVQITLPSGMAGGQSKAVSVGYQHVCLADAAGAPYCWGSNNNYETTSGSAQRQPFAIVRGAIPSGATIERVSAGQNMSCMIDTTKKLYCWGANANGQTGTGVGGTPVTTPTAVPAHP